VVVRVDAEEDLDPVTPDDGERQQTPLRHARAVSTQKRLR
jgi:hypothetical protein